MKRTLLVKMSSLGDVVHALPAVTDAAEHGVSFDWVVEEGFAPVAALHPGVHTVIPVAWRRWRKDLSAHREEMRRFWQRLREQRYDVILDSQGLIKSAAVSRMASGAIRAGFSRDCAREGASALLLDQAVHVPRDLHAIERQRLLFAAVFGYAVPAGMSYGIGRIAAVKPRTVLLLHGTTWSSKHYPEPLWLEIVTRAREDGFEVLVAHGSAEEERRALRFAAAGATVLDRMPLGGLIERLSTVAVVIGVDSGLSHIAAALDRPVVGLYGSTDPGLTGIRGRRVHNLVTTAPCAPCRRQVCALPDRAAQAVDPPCFGTLLPADVWRQARILADGIPAAAKLAEGS